MLFSKKKPRRIDIKILIKPNGDSLSFYVVLFPSVLCDFLRKDDEGFVLKPKCPQPPAQSPPPHPLPPLHSGLAAVTTARTGNGK